MTEKAVKGAFGKNKPEVEKKSLATRFQGVQQKMSQAHIQDPESITSLTEELVDIVNEQNKELQNQVFGFANDDKIEQLNIPMTMDIVQQTQERAKQLDIHPVRYLNLVLSQFFNSGDEVSFDN